jgi:hypothetical protein
MMRRVAIILGASQPTLALGRQTSNCHVGQDFLQVLRAFGIPQRKHLYFISVSGAFLGTSLPPTPNRSRFDLFIDVYSIFTVFFTLFIVFLATHCVLFIFLPAISFFESKVVICLCSAYAYAVFMLMPCLCLCSVFPAWCVLVWSCGSGLGWKAYFRLFLDDFFGDGAVLVSIFRKAAL